MSASEALRCPTCSTVIEVGSRCPAERGIGRCMAEVGHEGWHWSDVGAHPAILRWTGSYSTRSCPGRLSLAEWCEAAPGHAGPHRANGVSWVEEAAS